MEVNNHTIPMKYLLKTFVIMLIASSIIGGIFGGIMAVLFSPMIHAQQNQGNLELANHLELAKNIIIVCGSMVIYFLSFSVCVTAFILRKGQYQFNADKE